MRVLFDHNVPHKLRRFLQPHEVCTADEMFWNELENGALLKAGEDAGFSVMITGDKNLSYQQNLRGRKLALIVLSTNRWKIIKENIAPIIQALVSATPGSFQTVTFELPPRRPRSQ
jgi:hypothetical protein